MSFSVRYSTRAPPPPPPPPTPPPPLKKAKSEAASCSPADKNALRDFNSDNDALLDPKSVLLDTDLKSGDSAPSTANLSSKKATLPQPAKKLVKDLHCCRPFAVVTAAVGRRSPTAFSPLVSRQAVLLLFH